MSRTSRVGNELRPDLTWELRVSLFSAARGREVSTERDVWKHLDYSEPRVSNKSAPEHYVCVAEAAQASVVRH